MEGLRNVAKDLKRRHRKNLKILKEADEVLINLKRCGLKQHKLVDLAEDPIKL